MKLVIIVLAFLILLGGIGGLITWLFVELLPPAKREYFD